MQYITHVTQKGQITLSKALRDKLGINTYEKVVVTEENGKITIRSVQDIFAFAGAFPVPAARKGQDAGDAFSKAYKRF